MGRISGKGVCKKCGKDRWLYTMENLCWRCYEQEKREGVCTVCDERAQLYTAEDLCWKCYRRRNIARRKSQNINPLKKVSEKLCARCSMSKRDDWPGTRACADDGCIMTAPILGTSAAWRRTGRETPASEIDRQIARYYVEHRALGLRPLHMHNADYFITGG